MRVKNNKTFDVRFRYEFGSGPSQEMLEEVAELRLDIKALQEDLRKLEAAVDQSYSIKTSVSIVDEYSKEEYLGVVYKHPNDNHCRSKAREEALKCATSSMSKEDKTNVYAAWMNRPDGNGRI